jgi:transcription elongation factor GreA
MSQILTAAGLMRSLGLDVDGPTRWGSLPTSRVTGVFVVETATPLPVAPIDLTEVRRWLDRVPGLRLDGERPTQTTLAQRLASFWVPGQTLLYVGRASKGLASRVAAMYATELGHRRPHPGGHWLKTLRGQSSLRLWWAETDAAEEYEDALISAFADALPDELRDALTGAGPLLPWANLDSAAGAVRSTGLTGFLLSAEATPSQIPGVLRSDASTAVRRRAPSTTSASARSPRRTAAGAGSTSAPGSAKRERPTHLTADGLAAVEAELERLRTVDRPAVVERIKHARELGDLRENADYEAARNEQSFLEGRIQELEHRLRTAVVITAQPRGAIAMGSTVRYEIDGQPGELVIVGSTESDPGAGRISAASPVGKALLGRHVGDEVIVATPGAQIRYRIVAVG